MSSLRVSASAGVPPGRSRATLSSATPASWCAVTISATAVACAQRTALARASATTPPSGLATSATPPSRRTLPLLLVVTLLRPARTLRRLVVTPPRSAATPPRSAACPPMAMTRVCGLRTRSRRARAAAATTSTTAGTTVPALCPWVACAARGPLTATAAARSMLLAATTAPASPRWVASARRAPHGAATRRTTMVRVCRPRAAPRMRPRTTRSP